MTINKLISYTQNRYYALLFTTYIHTFTLLPFLANPNLIVINNSSTLHTQSSGIILLTQWLLAMVRQLDDYRLFHSLVPSPQEWPNAAPGAVCGP